MDRDSLRLLFASPARAPALDNAAAVDERSQGSRKICLYEARAKEAERARAQVVQRMQAARRDVYDANLRAEEAEARARNAEAAAAVASDQAKRAHIDAEARARKAETAAAIANDQARRARIERDRAQRDRDAVLHSIAWRVTWPLRTLAKHFSSEVQR